MSLKLWSHHSSGFLQKLERQKANGHKLMDTAGYHNWPSQGIQGPDDCPKGRFQN